MPRTTPKDVQAILAHNWDGKTPLQPFIDSVTTIVDEVYACSVRKSKTLSSTVLELIERWLAAHAYAMVDQPYAAKSTGKSSGSFQGQTGMHLDATKYGQQAKLIDTSRCLAAIDKGAVVKMTWIGKPVSEQVAYEDRD